MDRMECTLIFLGSNFFYVEEMAFVSNIFLKCCPHISIYDK